MATFKGAEIPGKTQGSSIGEEAEKSSADHRYLKQGDISSSQRLAVVIPCYRVLEKISAVIRQIGPEVEWIIVVDDSCPEGTGTQVTKLVSDPRIHVLKHVENRGVGGATKSGYEAALALGATIVIKIDGDGQMDPRQIPRLVAPILKGRADYCKGNRFSTPRTIASMPFVRRMGNAGLSFLTKVATGYWRIMDPTNGFTAIHHKCLRLLEFDRLAERYFFETDMLFRLHLVDAVVKDVPMPSIYGSEKSGLSEVQSLFEFSNNLAIRMIKRLVYDYFIRDFNFGTVAFLAGSALFWFGMIFGSFSWLEGVRTNTPNETGTIMLAVLPTILGFLC